jgi:hypothetical protein
MWYEPLDQNNSGKSCREAEAVGKRDSVLLVVQ